MRFPPINPPIDLLLLHQYQLLVDSRGLDSRDGASIAIGVENDSQEAHPDHQELFQAGPGHDISEPAGSNGVYSKIYRDSRCIVRVVVLFEVVTHKFERDDHQDQAYHVHVNHRSNEEGDEIRNLFGFY